MQSVESYCFCSLNMQILWRFRCRRVVILKLPNREFREFKIYDGDGRRKRYLKI